MNQQRNMLKTKKYEDQDEYEEEYVEDKNKDEDEN